MHFNLKCVGFLALDATSSNNITDRHCINFLCLFHAKLAITMKETPTRFKQNHK